MKLWIKSFLAGFLTVFLSSVATAQGQDGTRADRDITILAELLPGKYGNANQAYFDRRLKQPENQRHSSKFLVIEALDTDDPESPVLSFVLEDRKSENLTRGYFSFSVDYADRAVRMKTFLSDVKTASKQDFEAADYLNSCDLLWEQEAGQFRAKPAENGCRLSPDGPQLGYEMMFSEDALWISLEADKSPFAFDRARSFDCYIDVPGVGGGRDIPYKRYGLEGLHDMGAEKWVTLDDGRQVGLSLFKVMWPINNYENNFARPSMVVYVKDKDEDGNVRELGYAFTDSKAERIGVNLKWMLANCYVFSNEEIAPFYKENEPRLQNR